MLSPTICSSLFLLIAPGLASGATISNSSITFSANGNNLVIGVSEPVTFVVNTAKTDFRLAVTLQNMVATGFSGGFLTTYSPAGVPTLTSGSFTSNPNMSVADVDSQDLTVYFDFAGPPGTWPALAAGNQVTLSPGVFEVVNYLSTGFFPVPVLSGNIYLTGSGREVISGPVTVVPEASHSMLLILGTASMVLRRRK